MRAPWWVQQQNVHDGAQNWFGWNVLWIELVACNWGLKCLETMTDPGHKIMQWVLWIALIKRGTIIHRQNVLRRRLWIELLTHDLWLNSTQDWLRTEKEEELTVCRKPREGFSWWCWRSSGLRLHQGLTVSGQKTLWKVFLVALPKRRKNCPRTENLVEDFVDWAPDMHLMTEMETRPWCALGIKPLKWFCGWRSHEW